MGHLSTKTTEGYNCRKRNDAAIEAAKRTWDSNTKKNTLSEKGSQHVKLVREVGFEPTNPYETEYLTRTGVLSPAPLAGLATPAHTTETQF